MLLKRPRALLILLGVWTVVGLAFASLSYFGTLAINDYRRVDWGGIFFWNLVAFYLWALLSPLIATLARRFPVDRQRWPRSLAVHVPASFLFTVAHLCLYVPLYWIASGAVAAKSSNVPALFYFQLFANLPMKVAIYWLILIAIHALDYHRRLRAEEVTASELRAQLAQAQLRALKMQLHPHFLFNTLNSISALLHRDPEAADQMVARLGDFLRLTLENSGDQEVTLEQELEFLRCYLEIESVRFQDRLVVETEIDPQTLGARVPNLILQPLVENAIRHGISRQSTPGRLAIRARRDGDRLLMQVEDNGPGLALVSDGAASASTKTFTRSFAGGVGLANTRARLANLYGREQRIELSRAVPRGMIVTIEIPFLTEIVAVLKDEDEAELSHEEAQGQMDRAVS